MKKIKNIVLLVAMLLTTQNFVAQNWQWAKHFGGVNNDYGADLCKDASGNIYMTGTMMFPEGVFGTDTLIVNGTTDVYIVKMDATGSFIWAKRAGGTGAMVNDYGDFLKYESSSNTLITAGTMDGTGETMGACNLFTGKKIYVSKLDLSGNCIWAIGLVQGYSNVYITGITTDNNGFIYITGKTPTTTNFDGSITIAPGCFIAKINSTTGICIWAKNVISVPTALYNNFYIGDVHFQNNSLYLIGDKSFGTTLNDTLIVDTVTTYCYKNDAFVSKFDTTGNVLWVRTIGGPNSDLVGQLGLDANENIYVTGTFQDTAYFGSTMLNNSTNKDWFLAKYNTNGTFIWAKQTNAISTINYGAQSTDNNGNTYCSGTFSGTVSFGASTISAISPSDLFVTRYDSSGVCLGAKNVGNAFPYGILSDGTSGFYVSGGFNSNANFDGNIVTTYGNNDIFIAKCDAMTGINTNRTISSSNSLFIYANPNNGICNITVPNEFLNQKNLVLTIYDNMGKSIQQIPVESTQEKVKINMEEEATGIYNVTLSNGLKFYSGKIVFE
jgi:hypothetical protein